MTRITLLYFASLRDAAGMEQEPWETEARDLAELYAETAARHGFLLSSERVRVAMDDGFVSWQTPLREGSKIAFIPPVSGG